jgi:hypothetical protein
MTIKRFWPPTKRRNDGTITAIASGVIHAGSAVVLVKEYGAAKAVENDDFQKICGQLFNLFASAPPEFDKKQALQLVLKLAELHGVKNVCE